MRAGFAGEVIRTIGVVLMVVLAVKYYAVVGQWLRDRTTLAEEPANLIAFAGIAITVYVISLLLRLTVRRWTAKGANLVAVLDNFGGSVAGVVRMAVVMAVLTLALCLTRSPFLHQHVGAESRFGSFVLSQVPSIKEMLAKKYPEKMWFLEKVERREGPSEETAGAPKQ